MTHDLTPRPAPQPPAAPWRRPSHPRPSPRQVKEFLTRALRREVTLRPGEPLDPGPFLPASFAVYTDSALRVVATAVLDLPLSAYAGAAIAQVPVGGARLSITAMRLERPLELGLHRLLVELPELLAAPGQEPPRVYEVHPVGRSVSDLVRARALVHGDRQDHVITIPGYGAGRLALVYG